MAIKVLHLISGLRTGGAENMLQRMLTRTDRNRFESEVMSLIEVGPMGERFRQIGIPVGSLGMKRGIPNPLAVGRLIKRLREKRPDVIQTWLYHADLLGGLAAKFAGSIPVVWGIHNTTLDPRRSKRSTIWTVKINARLSHRLPQKIVCCSQTALALHQSLGYDRERMIFIPNGFDLDAFKPDPEARTLVREEIGIAEKTPLIGFVARFDPQKDHKNFIDAASMLLVERPDVHFLLCGDDTHWETPPLRDWIGQANITRNCHLLGRRDDMPQLNAAFDIATTSSAYGEAFPMTVGEAMACGVPCVVTDVGDSATMVDDTGLVVPPKNPEALAAAWKELLDSGTEKRKRLGEQARQRIREHFSLDVIAERYGDVYQSLARKEG